MKTITNIIIIYITILRLYSYGITTDQAYDIALKNPQIYQADKILNSNYKDLKSIVTPTEREVLKNEQRKWLAGLSQNINIVNNQVLITQRLLSYIENRNSELVNQWNRHIGLEQHARPIIVQTPRIYYPSTHVTPSSSPTVSNSQIFERQFTKPPATPTPTVVQYHYTNPNTVVTNSSVSEQKSSVNNNYGGLILVAIIVIIIALKSIGNSGRCDNNNSVSDAPKDTTKYINTVTQQGNQYVIVYTVGDSSSLQREYNTGIVVSFTQSVVSYRASENSKITTYNINTRQRNYNVG